MQSKMIETSVTLDLKAIDLKRETNRIPKAYIIHTHTHEPIRIRNHRVRIQNNSAHSYEAFSLKIDCRFKSIRRTGRLLLILRKPVTRNEFRNKWDASKQMLHTFCQQHEMCIYVSLGFHSAPFYLLKVESALTTVTRCEQHYQQRHPKTFTKHHHEPNVKCDTGLHTAHFSSVAAVLFVSIKSGSVLFDVLSLSLSIQFTMKLTTLDLWDK